MQADKKVIERNVDIVLKHVFFRYMLTLAASFVLIVWVHDLFEIGYDDTDGDERSGLKVYIDNKTKCEYLGTGSGGLTPRLDLSGKPICGR